MARLGARPVLDDPHAAGRLGRAMTPHRNNGEQTTIRYIWFDRISHARPVTVVQDTDDLIALYLAPGSACKACNHPGESEHYNATLLSRSWTLVDTVWRRNRV